MAAWEQVRNDNFEPGIYSERQGYHSVQIHTCINKHAVQEATKHLVVIY